jgi:hypothetical protein
VVTGGGLGYAHYDAIAGQVHRRLDGVRALSLEGSTLPLRRVKADAYAPKLHPGDPAPVYSQAPHFARAFRRSYGVSPSVYRETLRRRVREGRAASMDAAFEPESTGQLSVAA